MVATVAVLVWIVLIVSIKCCKSLLSIVSQSSLSLLIPRKRMILFLFAVGSTGTGILENLVSIIRSFHSCISAIVQCGDVVTDPISVRNRLRQGCTMACILFNIFMWVVVAKW